MQFEFMESGNSAVSISMIVPVHKGGMAFKRCLESIKSCLPQPLECIIVVDGNCEDDLRTARSYGFRVIGVEGPQGPAIARNRGASNAKGDILLFVDADVIVPRCIVSQVSTYFNQHQNVSAIFGSYDNAPDAKNFLSQYKNLMHHYVHQNSREEATTFWAGCGAVRQRVFSELDGFHESYSKPSIEDIELGYRLTLHGYDIHLLKSLQVKHLKRWEIVSLLKTDFFCRALPWSLLILRSKRFQNNLNIDLINRLSVCCVFLMLLSLPLAFFTLLYCLIAVVLSLVLCCLNFRFYCFMWRMRGGGFVALTIPWHWLYFFYSGAAFLLGGLQLSFQSTSARRYIP